MIDHISSYEDAVDYIYRIPRFNPKNTFQDIRHFLTCMGQPDRSMKIVHIAGTNGKGSTAFYMANLLQRAGIKTGLFTSPHLVDMRERIRINGGLVSQTLFLEAVNAVLFLRKEKMPDYEPCFFDMLFFICMYIFKKERVDIAVLETGLGGRLDATNAVSHKELALITRIGLDHTEYLGNTLTEIAYEKAGIIRKGAPVLVGAHNAQVRSVFVEEAARKGAVCQILADPLYQRTGNRKKSVAFSFYSKYYGTIPLQLHTQAVYQTDNISLALAGLDALIGQGLVPVQALDAKGIADVVSHIQWEGRMEEILPDVYLDGAHNPNGIEAFIQSVREDGCDGNRILIFSAVSDKNYREMLHMLYESGLFSDWIFTQIPGERGVPAGKLIAAAEALLNAATEPEQERGETAPERAKAHIGAAFTDGKNRLMGTERIADALSGAFALKKPGDYMYIVGSLYLAGQVKRCVGRESLQEGDQHDSV